MVGFIKIAKKKQKNGEIKELVLEKIMWFVFSYPCFNVLSEMYILDKVMG